MNKLALALIATVFSVGVYAQTSPVSAPDDGANTISTRSTVEKRHHKHHRHHGKIRHVRPA